MNVPASIALFQEAFPNWPEDSVSQRKDPIMSGSSWGIREVGTFQAVRRPPTDRIPLFLRGYWSEGQQRITEISELQSLFELLTRNWREMSHEQILRAAGPFASFLSALSQVMEEPIMAEADRLMRTRVHSQVDGQTTVAATAPTSSSSQDSSQPLSSSPPEQEYPNKRFRPDRSSDSYVPSDPESDQSIYDQRAKPEVATSSCINELLRCVTELSRRGPDPYIRMEWSIVPDTFKVHAGEHQFSSINDGGLVNRALRSGHWQRVSNLCHCSIEAKSWYNASGKLETVKGQEVAHLVGMFSQHIESRSFSEQGVIVPLISVSQNLFSLVYGQFSKEYQDYLRDGSQLGESSFIKVEEFGVFRLQDATELRTICTIIICLVLWSQDMMASR